MLRCRVCSPRGPEDVLWLDDAAVEIHDGEITSVGPWEGGLADEDLRPAVLVPGFVDAHLHYPQTRIVGSASGPLLDWLQRSTFPEPDPARTRRDETVELTVRWTVDGETVELGLVDGDLVGGVLDDLVRFLGAGVGTVAGLGVAGVRLHGGHVAIRQAVFGEEV